MSAAAALNGYTYDDAMALGLNLGLVLGPLVIASMINTFVYGICIMQLYEYYFACFHDGWKTTTFVSYLAILDTFAVCLNASLIWYYTVSGFGDITVTASTPWMYNVVPILSVMASCPIQHFLAWRIKRLTKSWIIFGIVSAISWASCISGIVASVLALQVGQVSNNTNLLPWADTWLAAATACDVSITCMLLVFLTKNRTGFSQKTDSMIEHLIKVSLESAVPVTIFTVCDLAILTTMPTSNVHMLFALGMGRVYTNTVLTTLNSRLKYRVGTTQDSSSNHQTIKLNQYSRRPQTQVRIDVNQDMMVDGAGFQKGSEPAGDAEYGAHGSSDGTDFKSHAV
ncbi:uncharacterized protein STEHIDRAFT_172679 [Stereum hirsutum FP-91666 SS1]|uniref:DUF6534 domain-containing protein n=1 Tax=Stereum hirsutum (strain FP-91666) TaxID=721885 RepID=R7RYD9_STEHR|nr:uncharacterized protein STEHIDRAFT_172679 [Stereum hirsutum FP-91666 SS1]EIM80421.1 hypothetical protein STEHIDRAFT_172679 [Stereum hirsutum FP-91666 SS1]